MTASRRDSWFCVALGALVFAVYAVTCARTLTGEDCGELAAAAYTGGVAHPPGYPLWTMLAHVATWIPLGEVAGRLAFLSAFFGGVTAAFLAAVSLRLVRSYPAAAVAALGSAFLRDQWSQAVIVEVYTLNSALLAACCWLVLRFDETKSFGRLNAFAFVYGLSLTNHLTMAGLAPAFLAFLLWRGWRLLRHVRALAVATGWFAAGLLPYLYLPLAARAAPAVNWGNPSTWDAFWAHVARVQYTEGATLPPATPERFQAQLAVLWDHAIHQGATPLLVLGALGVLVLLRRRPAVGLLLGGIACLSTWAVIRYTNFEPDFENAHANRLFFVPGYLAVVVAGAWALGMLQERIVARFGRPRLLGGATLLAALALSLPAVAKNWADSDYSHYRVVADYGRSLLVSVAPDAVLFPSADHHTFPLIYLQHVEGLRPDVVLGDQYGYVEPRLYRDAPFASSVSGRHARSEVLRRQVEAWLLETTDRPLYFSRPKSLPGGGAFRLGDEGHWFRARRPGDDPDFVQRAVDAAWGVIDLRPLPDQPHPLDYTARMVLSDSRFFAARRAFAAGQADVARRSAAAASAFAPEAKEIQNNVGSLLAEAGELTLARDYFARAVRLDADYRLARRNLASVLSAAGETAAAQAAWEALFHDDPDDFSANHALAELHRRAARWSEAAYFLTRAGRMARDPQLLRDAGLITLLELRQPGDAKALLEQSLALDPQQPDIAEVVADIKPVADPREELKKAGGKSSEKTDAVADGAERAVRPGAAGVPDPRAALRPPVPRAPSPFAAPTAAEVSAPAPRPAGAAGAARGIEPPTAGRPGAVGGPPR